MSSVRFMGVGDMTRWVSDRGAERIIAELATLIEDDFRRWPEFDKTPRVAAHSPEGVIELMPTSDGRQYGFKYVNGHPLNPSKGFQTVTALGLLADVGNGYPTFLSEMTILTALRTAATSAMAARHLASPGASVMAMIGCGSQAEFQALGFRALLGVTTLRIWDIDPAAVSKLARNARALGFDVVEATGPQDVTIGADIITTCTADKANAVVLTDAMVAPGVHVNAIGGDCPGKTELEPSILRRADVFVEYTPQTRIEGEIQHQPADFPVTELWEVIAGSRNGRTSPQAVTVFDSVGFAIEDFSALRFVSAATAGSGYATDIDLIAEPDDPKDLWAMVDTISQRVARV